MLEQIAWLLWDAERRAMPIAPVRQLVPDLTLSDAYEIRREGDLLRMADGAVPVGRRVFNAPDSASARYWCYILGRRRPPGGTVVQLARFIAPSVSAHLALELSTELSEQPTLAELVGAVGGFVPVLEISDRRTLDSSADDNPVELLADGGRHAGIVVGAGIPAQAVDWNTELSIRLRAGASSGAWSWRAALDDQLLNALAWLAGAVATTGEPLRGGELVIVGSAASVPLEPGQEYWGEFAGLGSELQLVGLRTLPA